jgi:hypothetical protein
MKMKDKRPQTKPPEQDEYATFSTALKKVLTVSHEEMQKRRQQLLGTTYLGRG